MPRKKAPPVEDQQSSLPVNPEPYRGTILEAMTAAGMTGSTWDPWRTFWKAVFALPMSADDLARYQKHTGRESPPAEPVLEAWQLIGRRGGKSRNSGIAGLFLAVSRNYTPLLAPGERAVLPIIASDRRQARQVLNFLKGAARMPAFRPYVLRELSGSVEFTTGVTVEIATASYRTIRGYTVVGLIADEMAFWRVEDSAEPDAEILDAVRPAMATIPNALLLVLSTPYARKGELYRAHKEYYGKAIPDILVWNADTLSMHNSPRIEADVKRKFDQDAVMAASEYGTGGQVVFRADVEAFVTPEVIDAATVENRFEMPRVEGIRYYGFTDPSGGSQDSWTLAIAHRDGDKILLDAIRETRPQFSPAAVVADYAKVLKGYGVAEVDGDHFAGEFPRELFRQHGVTYRVSDNAVSDIYREMLPLLNAGNVELLDNQVLRRQFCLLERYVGRSGQDIISHPKGGHDDLANAVSGAVVRAARKRPAQSVRFAL